MLTVIRNKATHDEIRRMAEDFDGYIKLVVDVRKGILAGGGKRHVEGEQKLLSEGSHQSDLWGGGVDLDTREIDYNSIINLRPAQGNPSREILSADVRKKFEMIVKKILL